MHLALPSSSRLTRIFDPIVLPSPALDTGIEPAHRVHNLTMAMSLIASTKSVALLPAYAENFLPSATSRPLRGAPPTIDLVIGYNKTNTLDSSFRPSSS